MLDGARLDRQLCTGLPNPQSTLIAAPTLFGIGLGSARAFAWFSLGILVLSVLMVRLWRDRGVARRLMAVRDNETGAGAMGIPLARTKLLAFALSGFIAGYAGVCLAFATERFSTDTFDPTFSILVVSMVVIGGLGTIDGAVLGAIYLVGIPAMFGSNPTIQFLTSGLGLLAFILYLPGGLAELLHRLGDVVTLGIEQIDRRRGTPPASGAGTIRRRCRWPPRWRGERRRRGRRPAGPARLDLEGVSVAFGGVQAVDGADLSAEPGAIVGLIGPNGSGKTTLLDVISGLVTPRGRLGPARRREPGRVPARGALGPRAGPVLPGLPALPRAQRGGGAVAHPGRRPSGGRAVLHPPHALGHPVRAGQATPPPTR